MTMHMYLTDMVERFENKPPHVQVETPEEQMEARLRMSGSARFLPEYRMRIASLRRTLSERNNGEEQ